MLQVLGREEGKVVLAQETFDKVPIELFSHNAKYLKLTKV